jgi:hypothetical protein
MVRYYLARESDAPISPIGGPLDYIFKPFFSLLIILFLLKKSIIDKKMKIYDSELKNNKFKLRSN